MIQAMPDTALGRAVRACRRYFGWALLFSALANLLLIMPMLYMLQVYERVVPTRGGTTLLLLTLVLLFALGTMAVLDTVRSRLLVLAGVRLDRLVARTILDTSLSLDGGGAGRGARQGVREFDLLRQALTGPAVIALLDAPWVPIYVLIAFLIHPWVGLLAAIGALLVILMAVRTETVTREKLQRAQVAAGQTYAEFDGSVTQADVVRALGMREALVTGHVAARETMIALQTEASLASSGLSAGSKFLRQLLQSLALGIGALLAIEGRISPGAIFAAMFIVGRALAPIDQLVGNWRTIVQARGAWRMLHDLLGAAPPDLALTHLPRPEGRVEVEQMHVLADDRRPILHNIGLSVARGEMVAVVGPSGAGKSTLVRALAGAVRPAHGLIRFDGADSRNWDPERLAEHVGFLPQDAALFAGTIKENIARFRNRLGEEPQAIDEAVVAAAREAGAHDLIQRLPGGYDQLLGPGGRGLSAGQAQRIALARALFRAPAILILDEPNSNLDAEGDQELAQCLARQKQLGTTVFLVAHRMSLLPIVDRMLVLREGRIVADGPRDEVLQKLNPPQTPRVAAPVEGVA